MRAALAPWRLPAQHLVGPELASPAAVVAHLGAVQSQMHDMSLWALGRRSGATLAEVEAAFAAGDFLRTHVLRPTWHHVMAADMRDLLELTAPRIRKVMASNNVRDGLPPDVLEHWSTLAIDVIHQDGPLTRPEVEARLGDAGYVRTGNGMAHVMIAAELTGTIHNGPPRGKQHTYIAADLPPSRRDPDERLAWLAETYLRGHGPAQPKDLAWWAGLTLTQARHAFDLADLTPVDLLGETFFCVGAPAEGEVPAVLLLPPFDEAISYARDGVDDVGPLMGSSGLLLVDGHLRGTWSRKVSADTTVLVVRPAIALDRRADAALEEEADRLARFTGRPATLTVA